MDINNDLVEITLELPSIVITEAIMHMHDNDLVINANSRGNNETHDDNDFNSLNDQSSDESFDLDDGSSTSNIHLNHDLDTEFIADESQFDMENIVFFTTGMESGNAMNMQENESWPDEEIVAWEHEQETLSRRCAIYLWLRTFWVNN
jgi:hypothetical protein